MCLYNGLLRNPKLSDDPLSEFALWVSYTITSYMLKLQFQITFPFILKLTL